MPLPFVARLAYDAMRDRAEAAEAREAALLDKYHALKAQGQVAVPVRPIPPAKAPEPSPEERAVLAAEQAFVQSAIHDLTQQGKSEREAREIAQFIAGEIRVSDTVPFDT